MKQYTILEYMDKLGVSYPTVESAWHDFYIWYRAMPVKQCPRVVRGLDSRKKIEQDFYIDKSRAGD